ncbi:hypothetical protein [Candidatus Poriferisodalis sp.]|uniref:hypothetical protein n=1 Tax=Candidatus Poriferisodalis sp. TaxID=3101277 RepID=UPI003B02165F
MLDPVFLGDGAKEAMLPVILGVREVKDAFASTGAKEIDINESSGRGLRSQDPKKRLGPQRDPSQGVPNGIGANMAGPFLPAAAGRRDRRDCVGRLGSTAVLFARAAPPEAICP